MIRKLVITAALATASFVGVAGPASAQSYGGITLSFGSGGYGGYDYDDDYNAGGYQGYYDPRWAGNPYYDIGWGGYSDYDYDDDYNPGGYQGYYDPRWAGSDSGYAWRAHERREQIERWQREQERRQHWRHEHREHDQGADDDDEE
jgi:hypothetical protein